MKQYILLVSLGAALLATIFGGWAVIGQHNLDTLDGATNAALNTIRLYQLAGISGLFSIASFFVGLAYPVTRTEVSSQSYDVVNKTTTDTRKVINN